MRVSAILLAAGESSRFEGEKLFAEILGESVLARAVRPFEAVDEVEEIIVCSKQEEAEAVQALLCGVTKPLKVILGGATRQQSVLNGLQNATLPYCIIHDCARANASIGLVQRVCAELDRSVGVIPVVPMVDSVISTENGLHYPDRSNLFSVQTPQGFCKDKLIDALTKGQNTRFTDDGSAFLADNPLTVIEGETGNRKLTYPFELYGIAGKLRVGNGYDTHKLVLGRALILGGVHIPYSKGLLGHSDADVVLHALMDALLNTAALGDIGKLFPDTNEKYKNANSVGLTLTVLNMLAKKGGYVQNVALTILAQQPKLAPYEQAMRQNIAALCGISTDAVGITATTTEGLGFIGREEGIACYATVCCRFSD